MGWGDAQNSLKKHDLRTLRSLIQSRRHKTSRQVVQTDRPVWDSVHRQYCVHLSRSSRIAGMDLPEGSEVYYTPQGRLASIFLSDTTQIAGQTFPPASMVHLYADGSLDWISLNREAFIEASYPDFPRLAVKRQVSYYRNGQLKEAMLARSTVVQGHLLLADTIIHFSNDGRLVWAQLSGTTTFIIGEQSLSANSQSCVEFHRNGKIRCLTLAQATLLQGHRFDPHVQVKFDPEGHLAMASISASQTQRTTHYNTVLRFERNGSIKEITVS